MHVLVLRLLPLLLGSLVSCRFTPKDLLSAPRTSPAIPNPSGTFALYTQSTYSFENDTRTGGLFLIPITSPKDKSDTFEDVNTESDIKPQWLVNSTSVSDPQWISDSIILYIDTTSQGSLLQILDINSGKTSLVHSFDAEIADLKVYFGKNLTRIAFSAKVNQK